MELLILLVTRSGNLVSREAIAEHLWGKDVFVDVDHSINVAVRKIRLVLQDDPEKPRFVETVVGKGYRFAAPVVCGNGVSNSQAQGPPPTEAATAPKLLGKDASDPGASAKKERFVSSHAKVLFAGAVVLVFAILAFVLYGGRNARNAKQPAIKSLAVLPLKNLSGDPSQEYLADGLTEALIGSLSGIHDLRVISRTSVMHFKDPQLTVPEIAKTLHVDAIVEGSMIRDGNRIRVHAQLIRANTDEHFWSETYDRELQDLLALESEVAQSIAGKVEVTISGEEHERLAQVRSVSPDVYENYLKGQFALENSSGRGDTEKSIDYFQTAIQKDPTFAPAYIGLATAYRDLSTVFVGVRPEEVRPKITEAARKALELDPQSVEAHVMLADMERIGWRWADAEAEYRRALELNPHAAAAQLGLAQWLLDQGQVDEALARARRSRELDPLAVSGRDIGWILFSARRYNEAIREYHSVLAVKPDDAETLWDLGFALIANGQPQEAILVLEKALTVSNRSPGVIGVLIRAYAHAGRRRDALRLLAELRRSQEAGYVPAGAFVNAYLGLGENEQALVWLEQAYKEHSNILVYLKVHPFFDPLRTDPRFADLARRVRLE
jgi:TolB-like protein/DNA-binding winged helix-turn-helix (wHTH) protein/Tfp pilus assembly protein PilF